MHSFVTSKNVKWCHLIWPTLQFHSIRRTRKSYPRMKHEADRITCSVPQISSFEIFQNCGFHDVITDVIWSGSVRITQTIHTGEHQIVLKYQLISTSAFSKCGQQGRIQSKLDYRPCSEKNVGPLIHCVQKKTPTHIFFHISMNYLRI